MTVKTKIKYAVAYNSSTDVLSTKLNVLLNNIVTLITTNNPALSELTRITYGSSSMTAAPLYDNTAYVDYGNSNKVFQSDVVFLGTNADNIVLSICFYAGRLVIAMNMDPSVEALYMDIWDDIKYDSNVQRTFAVAKACRFVTSTERGINHYNVNLPYVISNNTIEISVVYWTGTYSSGYMFYNGNRISNGVDLVIYKTTEDQQGTAGLGAALYRYSSADNSYNNYEQPCLLAWSFNESLKDNIITDHKLTNSVDTVTSSTVFANGKRDPREWFKTCGSTSSDLNNFRYTNMADYHTLGYCDGKRDGNYQYIKTMPVISNVDTSDYNNSTFISPLVTAYNLPFLDDDTKGYFRKMHIPGFNKYCSGEIYLMWSPTASGYTSGDIVTCDNKQFAVISNGAVCWAARIE